MSVLRFSYNIMCAMMETDQKQLLSVCSTMHIQIYAEGGPGVKQSNETALKYFKKAADQVLWGLTSRSGNVWGSTSRSGTVGLD